jgi:hypothetical protein
VFKNNYDLWYISIRIYKKMCAYVYMHAHIRIQIYMHANKFVLTHFELKIQSNLTYVNIYIIYIYVGLLLFIHSFLYFFYFKIILFKKLMHNNEVAYFFA